MFYVCPSTTVITYADSNRGVGFWGAFVCLSVRLSAFVLDILKTAAASITKLDPLGDIVRPINSSTYQKHCRHGSLHFCECWLLLLYLTVNRFNLTCSCVVMYLCLKSFTSQLLVLTINLGLSRLKMKRMTLHHPHASSNSHSSSFARTVRTRSSETIYLLPTLPLFKKIIFHFHSRRWAK